MNNKRRLKSVTKADSSLGYREINPEKLYSALKSPYPTNKISSSPYTLLTLIPKTLLEEFQKQISYFWLTLIIFFSFYLDVQAFSLKWYILIVFFLLLFSPLAVNIKLMINRKRSDLRINKTEVNLWKPFQFTSVASESLQVGDVILVSMFEEVPADILLLACKEGKKVQIMMNHNLGKEEVFEKRVLENFRINKELDQNDILMNLKKIESLSVLTPNKSFDRFKAKIRFRGNPKTYIAGSDEFVIGGSTVVGNEWVLGIVVYTGIDTKVWINSTTWSGAKVSKMLKEINLVHMFLFLIIVAIVFIIEILKFTYPNSFENYNTGESIMWNSILFGNLISVSLIVTMRLAKIISVAIIRFKSGDVSISFKVLQELGKVEYIVAEKNEIVGGEKLKLTAFGFGDKFYYREINFSAQGSDNQYRIINSNGYQELLPEYQTFEDLEIAVKSNNSSKYLQEFLFSVFFTSQQIKEVCIQVRTEDKVTQKALKTLGVSVQYQASKEIALKFNDSIHKYSIIGEYVEDIHQNSILVKSDQDSYFLFAKFDLNTVLLIPGGEDFVNSFKINFYADFKGIFYAYKPLSLADGEEFSFSISLALKSTLNSEGKVKQAFEKYSKDLIFLGFLGFEYKKLLKVSKTLERLNKIGIKTWMVSGDSRDNSLLACYSSGLFSKSIKVKNLTNLETTDQSITTLNRILEEESGSHGLNECQIENSSTVLNPLQKQQTARGIYERRVRDRNPLVSPSLLSPSLLSLRRQSTLKQLLTSKSVKLNIEIQIPKIEEIESVNYCLVVDSVSLSTVLSTKETRRLFVIVLFLARSVCFYGLTPDQKQSVVKILKNSFSFAPTVMALSGYKNNSMMLNEANVSVAVKDSVKKLQDFETLVTIPDFSKVADIILIHGHYSYVRLARMFQFALCRELMICVILFLYEFHSGFSGSYLLDIDLFVLLELLVTLLPLLLTGIFETDVPEKIAKKSDTVYSVGYFNFLASGKCLAFYSLIGVLQGIITYFFLIYGVGDILNSKGLTEDSEVLGTLFFIVISLGFVLNIIITTQKYYFSMLVFTIVTGGLIALCVGLTYTGKLSTYNNSQEILLGQGRFWVLVATVPLLLSVCYYMFGALYFEVFKLKFRSRVDMFKNSLGKLYKDTNIWKEKQQIKSFKIDKISLRFMSAYQEQHYFTQLNSRYIKVLRIVFGVIFVFILLYLIFVYTSLITSIKYQNFAVIPAIITFIFLLVSFYTKESCKQLVFFFTIFVLTIFVVDSVLNNSFTMLRYPPIEVLFSICFNLYWKLTLVQTLLTFIVSVCIFTYEVTVFDSSTADVTMAYCISLNMGITFLCLVIAYIIDYSRRVEYAFVEKAKKQFAKSTEILSYLLPEFVKKRVNDGVRYIAEDKGVVTVVFCDICEFDKIVEEYTSSEIVLLLDDFFSRIDKICEIVGVSKIETVGKTYMACSGLSDFDFDLNSNINEIPHPRRAIEMAFAVLQEAEKTVLKNGEGLKMKIGIHSGPVVAGVVGYHKPQFSLVGDTVNTASRMASTLEFYNKIQMSLETHRLLEDHSGLHFINNYPVVKGKGVMRTLIVEPSRKSTDNIVEERIETRESSASAIPIITPEVITRRISKVVEEIPKKLQYFQNNLPLGKKLAQILCIETQAEQEFQLVISKNCFLVQKFGLLTSAIVNFTLIIIASVEISFEIKYSSKARLSILCIEELLTILFLFYLKRVHKRRLCSILLNLLYWIEIILFFSLEFAFNTDFTVDMLFFYLRFILLNFCTGDFFFRSAISNILLITIMLLKIYYFSPVLEEFFFAVFFAICVLSTTYIRESRLRTDNIIRYILKQENEKTEQLLTQMLPSKALKNLQEEVIETDKLTIVTIMYADIVGFTAWSSQRSPAEVIGMLSELFTRFDKMCVEFGIYKVYTIGDCYVAMGYNGAAKRNPALEAKQMALFAFSLISLIQEVNERIGGGLDMRIGMHTGDIIGGMNGTEIIRYDIYGKDVMIANKMESNGVPGKINVSETTKELLEGFMPGEFEFEYLKDVKAWDRSVKAYLTRKADAII